MFLSCILQPISYHLNKGMQTLTFQNLQGNTWLIRAFAKSFHPSWCFTTCLKARRLEMCNLQTICKCKWHDDPPNSFQSTQPRCTWWF
jgi:hypothetical protein